MMGLPRLVSMNPEPRHVDRLTRWRWKTARALVPRRTVHSRGLTFTLQCDNWMTYFRWLSYNEKEPETLDWMDRHARDGDVLFDVGANMGVYTLYFALRHPRSRVVAFEPEFANLHLLRDNTTENCIQEKVAIYALALSRRTGLSWLHVHDLTPSSSLHTEARGPLATTRFGRPVLWKEGIYTMALDDFCRESGLEPDCLKLDVDGTEEEVLAGGRRTLAQSRLRTILVEVSREPDSRRACEAILRDAGFQCVWQDPALGSMNQVWQRTNNASAAIARPEVGRA